MAPLLTYAVGDSLMWGQGLRLEDNFAFRATATIADARGLTPQFNLLARSGAKVRENREKRKKFVDTFPSLFVNDAEREQFIAGADDGPAEPLFGEIPRAFPTILQQIASIPDERASAVNLLLITGGANDIDFVSVLETQIDQGGDFLRQYDEEFRRVLYDGSIEVIRAARRRCPNAHIVFTGYYSAFSTESDFSGMKGFFLELSGHAQAYEYLSVARVAAPVLGLGLLGFAGFLAAKLTVDRLWDDANDEIERAVAVARAVSEAGEARWLYWMRKAVTDINELPEHSDIRGPGVGFAAAGFLPRNCMFAPQSFIWQEFRVDALNDDRHDIRARRCPRNDLRDRMAQFRSLHKAPALGDFPGSVRTAAAWLINQLDGPLELRRELAKIVDEGVLIKDDHVFLRFKLRTLLDDEVDRIDVTRIASVIHPNRQGSAHYAEVIHKRAEELRRVSVRGQIRKFVPPTSPAGGSRSLMVGKALRRFGMAPNRGLRALLAHAEPDVVGLVVVTHPSSEFISRKVFLNLGRGGRFELRHLLAKDIGHGPELNPHFRPGTRDFFTIDIAGSLRIRDITKAVIELDKTPSVGGETVTWRPERIVFSIDGRDVFERAFTEVAISDELVLDYPLPSG